MLGRLVLFYTILSGELLYFCIVPYRYIFLSEKIEQSQVVPAVMTLVATGYVFRTTNREYFKTATTLRICTVIVAIIGSVDFIISFFQ